MVTRQATLPAMLQPPQVPKSGCELNLLETTAVPWKDDLEWAIIAAMRCRMFGLLPIFALLIGVPLAVRAENPVQCQAIFESTNSSTALRSLVRGRLQLLRRGEFPILVNGQNYVAGGIMMFRPAVVSDSAPGSVIGEMKFYAGVDGAANHVAGVADVAYYPLKRTLDIRRTVIFEGFGKNGLTTLAVGAALEKFPDTLQITGRLVQDNAASFEAIYQKATGGTRDERVLEAFRGTPFYKTARDHGFTEVDMKVSYYRPQMGNAIDRISIQLRRPARPAIELLREGEYVIAAKGETYKIRGELKPRSLNSVMDQPSAIMAEIGFSAWPASQAEPLYPNAIGSNTVAYFSATRRLEITRTVIEEGFEKKGLTTAFVGAALDMFPETEVITGYLIRENAKAFAFGYSKSTALTLEAKIADAFRTTPFYKTVRAYGFTEIDTQASFYRPEKEDAIDQLFIKLRRPVR